MRLSGPIVDRAGDGDVLQGAGYMAEQAVVSGPLLAERHAGNGVAAAVKDAGKTGAPKADGDPLGPGHIQVRREAHRHIGPAGQLPAVDHTGKIQQFLRQTDLQGHFFADRGL